MSNNYILDACSLIALLTNEDGVDTVKNLLQKAINGEINVLMHKVNFFEVYYYTYKKYGEKTALKLVDDIKLTPIKMNIEHEPS